MCSKGRQTTADPIGNKPRSAAQKAHLWRGDEQPWGSRHTARGLSPCRHPPIVSERQAGTRLCPSTGCAVLSGAVRKDTSLQTGLSSFWYQHQLLYVRTAEQLPYETELQLKLILTQHTCKSASRTGRASWPRF